jgi:hypothetical protein
MLHPDLVRALGTAHIEDLHRAAARRRTIRLARRVADEARVAATPIATQRSASESAAWTSRAQTDGMTPTEIAQAVPWPCQSAVGVRSGARAGIARASSETRPAPSLTPTSCRPE